jgi:hypothetical protein
MYIYCKIKQIWIEINKSLDHMYHPSGHYLLSSSIYTGIYL